MSAVMSERRSGLAWLMTPANDPAPSRAMELLEELRRESAEVDRLTNNYNCISHDNRRRILARASRRLNEIHAELAKHIGTAPTPPVSRPFLVESQES